MSVRSSVAVNSVLLWSRRSPLGLLGGTALLVAPPRGVFEQLDNNVVGLLRGTEEGFDLGEVIRRSPAPRSRIS